MKVDRKHWRSEGGRTGSQVDWNWGHCGHVAYAVVIRLQGALVIDCFVTELTMRDIWHFLHRKPETNSRILWQDLLSCLKTQKLRVRQFVRLREKLNASETIQKHQLLENIDSFQDCWQKKDLTLCYVHFIVLVSPSST